MKPLSIAIVMVAVLICSSAAFGHSWYDYDCCDEEDCRPAFHGEVLEEDGGFRVVPTGEHFPYDSPNARPSKDGEYHICQFQTSSGYFKQSPVETKTRCVYYPAPGV